MNWLWEFVWGLMPWWAWLILGVGLAAVAYRLLGWKGVVAVVATTAGVVAYSRGAKKGIEVERAKQDAADDKAREVIADKKADTKTMSDKELDQEVDKWTRRS